MNRLDDTILRLLTERLENFKIPVDVISNLKNDIVAAIHRPEVKVHGATVMTAAASLAADQARKRGPLASDPKPEII